MLVAVLLGVSVGVGMCVYYVRRTLHRATHVIETHTHGDGPRARIHTTTHTPTSKSARSVLFKILWSGLQVNAVALAFAFRFEDFFEYYLMLQQAVMSVYVCGNVWKYTCVALYMCVRGIYIIHEYTRSLMQHTRIYTYTYTYTHTQVSSVGASALRLKCISGLLYPVYAEALVYMIVPVRSCIQTHIHTCVFSHSLTFHIQTYIYMNTHSHTHSHTYTGCSPARSGNRSYYVLQEQAIHADYVHCVSGAVLEWVSE